MTTFAVTGATGNLGGLAVEALLRRGVDPSDIVAIVRDSSKATDLTDRGVQVRVADYADTEALTSALRGVDRLLLVSSPTVGQRLAQHTNVIDAAKSASVPLLAYTSILRADTSPMQLAAEHAATEEALRGSGLDLILLRNGWYWENYLAAAPAAIETGVLYGSAGTGLIAGAARADYADAAAAALIDGTPGTYELVGDEHLSSNDLATTLGAVSGKPVRYENLSEADYTAGLVQAGLPAGFAAVLADSDAKAAGGALDSDSTDLARLRGVTSTPFVAVVEGAIKG